MKNKVQTVKNSHEVTNSSIKQTQNIRGCVNVRRDERCFNDYRGDKCQNHAHAETKSSESVGRVTLVQLMARKTKEENRNDHRDWDKCTTLELTGRVRREQNTETRTRRTRRRSKPRKVRRRNALELETSSRRKSSRTSLHEGKSMLKHSMRKCKFVNYADKETSSGTQISSRR